MLYCMNNRGEAEKERGSQTCKLTHRSSPGASLAEESTFNTAQQGIATHRRLNRNRVGAIVCNVELEASGSTCVCLRIHQP